MLEPRGWGVPSTRTSGRKVFTYGGETCLVVSHQFRAVAGGHKPPLAVTPDNPAQESGSLGCRPGRLMARQRTGDIWGSAPMALANHMPWNGKEAPGWRLGVVGRSRTW